MGAEKVKTILNYTLLEASLGYIKTQKLPF